MVLCVGFVSVLFLATFYGQGHTYPIFFDSEMIKVMADLGWKEFLLITGDNSTSHYADWQYLKAASNLTVQVSTRFQNITTCFDQRNRAVIIWQPHQRLDLESSLVCSDSYSILIMCKSCLDDLIDTMKEFDITKGCYLYDIDRKKIKRINLFKGRSLVAHSFIDEPYNFNGGPLRLINGDWIPYMKMLKNTGSNVRCEVEGIFPDIFSLLGGIYNFSNEYYCNENWGNINGDFVNETGNETVLESVVKGLFDITPGPWTHFYNRDSWLDSSAPYFYTNRILVANLKNSPVDYSLFLRPFQNNAWMVITLSAILILGQLKLLNKFQQCDHYRLICFSGWTCFLLLNAFYGGACTMFFTAPPKVPFNSILEGANAYPEWSLFILKDTTGVLEEPQYQKALERITGDPEKFIMPNFHSCIDRVINDPGSFFYAADLRMIYFANENPALKDNLFIFGDKQIMGISALLPHRSPYKAMINEGLLKLTRLGIMDRIRSKWVGSDLNSQHAAEKKVLTLGNVVLAFVMLGGAFILCLLLLAFELINNMKEPR